MAKLSLRQIIQIFEEDIEVERENSSELLDQMSRLLFVFGKTLVNDFRNLHGRRFEGIKEIEAIYSWLSFSNKGEVEELRELRSEAVAHYFYVIGNPALERKFNDPFEAHLKDVVGQFLLTRIAEDWLRPLLSLDSNGRIVVE